MHHFIATTTAFHRLLKKLDTREPHISMLESHSKHYYIKGSAKSQERTKRWGLFSLQHLSLSILENA